MDGWVERSPRDTLRTPRAGVVRHCMVSHNLDYVYARGGRRYAVLFPNLDSTLRVLTQARCVASYLRYMLWPSHTGTWLIRLDMEIIASASDKVRITRIYFL